MKHTLRFLFWFLAVASFAQTGIPVPEMTHCDTQAMNFMATYDIPSMTFAMTKDGKLIYSRAFGYADIGETEMTQPYNMFRIASVSKPLTAVGIMKMVEDGDIGLDDYVFGAGGLLENHWYFSTADIVDSRVYDITVRMLLEHNAGWNRDINCFPNPTTPYPWYFGGCDPIAVPMHVTETLGESNPVVEEYLIAFVLGKTLNYDPGTVYNYSNMGYLILSEIIEEISGMDYEAWMQLEIMNPLGIYDMHIGKNLLEDKKEREGEYVGNGYTTLSLYGDGTTVPWEYGGFSVEAMDGHGGWMATSRDLLRLMVAVDGFSTKPDILESATINTMVTPSTTNSFYAKGWSVNSANNWWHTGALDGTATILVRSNGGYTWAILLNKRVIGTSANSFWNALDGLGWNCISGTSTFPTHDLFEAPLMPASNLQASNMTQTSMDLSWTNGDGEQRVVVAKALTSTSEAPYFSNYPMDGTVYTANATFGTGDDLGDGSFVIYNGTGTSMSLSGLTEDTEYAIRVYEYKQNSVGGNQALYLLGNAPQLVQSTSSLSIQDVTLQSLQVYPNPTQDIISIQNPNSLDLEKAVISDMRGRIILEKALNTATEISLSLEAFQDGMYMLTITSQQGDVTKRIIKE